MNFLEFNSKDTIDESNPKENAQYIICSEIKKQGKQKSFCEEKFLEVEGVIHFFNNFIGILSKNKKTTGGKNCRELFRQFL